MQTVFVHWSVVLSLFIGMLMGQISKIHDFGDAAGIFIYKNYYLFQLLRSLFALSYCCPLLSLSRHCNSYSFSYWYSYSYSYSYSFIFIITMMWFLNELAPPTRIDCLFIASPATTVRWFPTPHVDRQHLPTHLAAIGPSPSVQLRCFKRLGAWYDATPQKKGRRKESYKRCSYVPPKRVKRV